ncbi:hypothetical protein DSECCO2_532180 [anaerobic digester metagenome]
MTIFLRAGSTQKCSPDLSITAVQQHEEKVSKTAICSLIICSCTIDNMHSVDIIGVQHNGHQPGLPNGNARVIATTDVGAVQQLPGGFIKPEVIRPCRTCIIIKSAAIQKGRICCKFVANNMKDVSADRHHFGSQSPVHTRIGTTEICCPHQRAVRVEFGNVQVVRCPHIQIRSTAGAHSRVCVRRAVAISRNE